MRADSTEPKLNVTPLMGAQSSTDSELSKSVPPLMRPTTKPMSGVIRPSTMPFTIAVNALPITTPTDRSSTLPRMINSLNSSKSFFMCEPFLFAGGYCACPSDAPGCT